MHKPLSREGQLILGGEAQSGDTMMEKNIYQTF